MAENDLGLGRRRLAASKLRLFHRFSPYGMMS
jgi:hypothetical protein